MESILGLPETIVFRSSYYSQNFTTLSSSYDQPTPHRTLSFYHPRSLHVLFPAYLYAYISSLLYTRLIDVSVYLFIYFNRRWRTRDQWRRRRRRPSKLVQPASIRERSAKKKPAFSRHSFQHQRLKNSKQCTRCTVCAIYRG